MKKNRFRRKGTGKEVFAIVVDGDTEIWYFQMMKKFEKLSKVDIQPDLPKKKKLKEQFEHVKEGARIYDKVIWLIDLDTINKEDRKRKASDPPKIREFQRYIEELKVMKNVHVLVNSPCLEFWFLLHFSKTGRYFQKCETAENELRKIFTGYNKNRKFFLNPPQDIYTKLHSYQKDAISNAEKLGEFDFENPHKAVAETYKLFELFGM